MGVYLAGGQCRRPRCLVCHAELNLLHRLLGHDVCQPCHLANPIIDKSARASTFRLVGSRAPGGEPLQVPPPGPFSPLSAVGAAPFAALPVAAGRGDLSTEVGT